MRITALLLAVFALGALLPPLTLAYGQAVLEVSWSAALALCF